MKKNLIARQSMSYAQRRLKAGDAFQASRRDADLLIRLGRATTAEADLTDLRREYEEAVGKRPYHGWDAATLREKMVEAQGDDGRYERRDMRASE